MCCFPLTVSLLFSLLFFLLSLHSAYTILRIYVLKSLQFIIMDDTKPYESKHFHMDKIIYLLIHLVYWEWMIVCL